jgi:hypothetical protein
MPTKTGMRKPEDSYFPTVKLFDDLPTIKAFPGSKEKFLVALGVRKTVELPVVFERMRNRDSDAWNHIDLIRYFASVMDEMPKKDMDRLKETAFLPAEGGARRVEPQESNTDLSKSKGFKAPTAEVSKNGQLFKAADLYAPDQALLSMGLSQVKLPFEFKPNVREGALLLRLGLKQWPDSITLAGIMHRAGQSNDVQLYSLTMQYFLQNYYKNGYAGEKEKMSALTIPILPTEQAPFPAMVGPFQCFTNAACSCLGYAVLRGDLRPHAEKFGVQHNPELSDCVQRLLKSPPKVKLDAEMQFSYLASRGAELDQHRALTNSISASNIVPIFRKYYLDSTCAGFEDRTRHQFGATDMRYHHHDSPDTVFVGRDQEWRGILDYVNYSSEATAFLLKVGAKHEPSSLDLASLLCKNPARFLNTIGQERYLELLRKLAEHAGSLWKDKELVKLMVASRALLGYRDIKDDTNKLIDVEEDAMDDLDEPGMHREWSLNRANELVVIDDVGMFIRFRE